MFSRRQRIAICAATAAYVCITVLLYGIKHVSNPELALLLGARMLWLILLSWNGGAALRSGYKSGKLVGAIALAGILFIADYAMFLGALRGHLDDALNQFFVLSFWGTFVFLVLGFSSGLEGTRYAKPMFGGQTWNESVAELHREE